MSEHEPWWEPLIYKAFLRFAAKWVDLFIANSKHTLERLQRIPSIGRRPGIVVYNSILDEVRATSPKEQERARSVLSLPNDAFIFGFAGRIVERKGWRDFLECAEHFRTDAGIFWIMAGDGPEEAHLLRICANKHMTNLRPLGFQQDMRTFYQSLNACIIPSHWEPHGLVQLEAQSFGLPVIAADVPGMNETLAGETNALLFAPQDTPALIRRVESILRSPELLESLSRASLSNAKHFTLEKYHDSLESCYTKLDGPPGVSRSATSQ